MSSPIPDLVPEWMADGACRNMPTAVFFPEKDEGAKWKQAKDTCSACPVQMECLDYAIRWNIQHGIWGGMGPKTRKLYARRRNLRAMLVQ